MTWRTRLKIHKFLYVVHFLHVLNLEYETVFSF